MTQAYWLLEVEVGGAVYRWASTVLEVPDGSDTLTYEPGLTLPSQLEVGAEDVNISITDPGVDWPADGYRLLGQRGTIRRWQEGDDISLALVMMIGTVTELSHGTSDEPATFTLTQSLAANRGQQVPHPFLRIEGPIIGSGEELGIDEGKYYPILFGAPGDVNPRPYEAKAGGITAIYLPYAVMPVPILSRRSTDGRTGVVLHLGVNSNRTEQVQLRNVTLDAGQLFTPTVQTDLRGQTRTVIHTTSTSPLNPATVEEDAEFYAGFYHGSGGEYSSVWQAVQYLLDTYGGDVDWQRMSLVEADLSRLTCDTWIDSPIRDPWVWIEEVTGDLPFETRTGPRGLYLERIRWVPDGSRYVRSVTHGDDADRIGGRSFAVGELNEFEAKFRPGRDDWRGRVLVTGDTIPSAPPWINPRSTPEIADNAFQERIVSDARCEASVARIGLRQAPPIEIDWTWDVTTAVQVLDWQVEQHCVPSWESEYWIEDGHTLRVGDELRLTDDDMGLTDELAVVMTPPIVTLDRWSRVLLRYRAR